MGQGYSCFGPGPQPPADEKSALPAPARSHQAPVSKGGAGSKAPPADAGLPPAPGTPPATPTAQAAASSNSSRLSEDTAYDAAEAVQPLDDMRPVSDAQSCRTSARGLPYRAINNGPPKPPCNAQRLSRLRQLDVMDKPPDPEIEHIVQLACTVFGTENALVALLEGERIFIRNATGNFAPGDFPWRYSFCGYTLVPKNPTAMVIEDAREDARFRNNAFVTGGFGVRFYAGTPLVASDGHRLGTLCFADAAPRAFDAERCNILNNMAELVVRELERGWAMRAARKSAAQMQQVNQGLLRAMDCFQEAIMMVDARPPGWRIMHLNQAAIAQTGIKREAGLAGRFWDLFERPHQSAASSASAGPGWAAAAAAGEAFALHDVARRSSRPCPSSGSSRASERHFSLSFRPAATEALDDNTAAIGIPSYMGMSSRDSAAPGAGLFFVTVHETMLIESGSSCQSRASGLPAVIPFEGLELGPLLGKGGYGRVFRGIYRGRRVAVKVIDDGATVRTRGGQPLEAVIMEGLAHAGVVGTLAHCVLPPRGRLHDSAASTGPAGSPRGAKPERAPALAAAAEEGGAAAAAAAEAPAPAGEGRGLAGQAWLLLEYCDKGCLQEAIDKGWFRTQRSQLEGGVDMAAVLATAAEVAAGMAFLHARAVVHGDLTGGNVLLASADAPHGFCAKVCDFGLARSMDVASRIDTRTYGTVTHMPPELLASGVLGRACDVWSFGILLWEMVAGCRAWASMTHAQVIHAVIVDHTQLVFPASAPPGYAALGRRCLAPEPAARPSFAEVGAELARLRTARA